MMESRFLFRGMRMDGEGWAIGHYLLWRDRQSGNYAPVIQQMYLETRGHSIHFIDLNTIGQCTSLSAAKSYRGDKPEDLLVFEGDILKILFGNKAIQVTVRWDEKTTIGHAGFVFDNDNRKGDYLPLYMTKSAEIIGTIYDDPPN